MIPQPTSLFDDTGFRDLRSPKPVTAHSYSRRWQIKAEQQAHRDAAKDPGALLRCRHCRGSCEPGRCPTGRDTND